MHICFYLCLASVLPCTSSVHRPTCSHLGSSLPSSMCLSMASPCKLSPRLANIVAHALAGLPDQQPVTAREGSCGALGVLCYSNV